MADSALSLRPSPQSSGSVPRERAFICVAVLSGVAFGILDSRVVVTLVVSALVFLVSLERPVIGVSALLASVPLQDAWPAQIGGTTTTWTRVIFLVLITAWLIRLALGRERIRLTPVCWVFALFLGLLVLSILPARDIGAWAEEVYRWGVAFAVLLVASSLSLKPRDIRWVLSGLAAGILLSFVVSLNQVYTSSGPATFQQRGLTRAYGYFGEPNPLAGYLEMATLPLIAIGLHRLRNRKSSSYTDVSILLVFGVIGSATLVLTQSRGGLLGFVTGIAVILWLEFPGWGKRLVVTGGLLTGIFLFMPQSLQVRDSLGISSMFHSGPIQVTSENWATQERLAHWGAAIRMWAEHPWSGIGAGNFNDRFREFTPTWRFRISRGHAHSAYLQAAAQAGGFGFATYLLVLSAVIHRSWRVLRSNSANDVGLVVGTIAVTMAIAMHGVFDYLHVLSLGIVLSVIWALNDSIEVTPVSETVKHVGN